MAVAENTELLMFLESGIYNFPDSNCVFIDPVRILDRNYSRFRVSPSVYYSRFFNSKFAGEEEEEEKSRVLANTRKRKRKQKKTKKNHSYALNDKELVADQRHQKIRDLLVKAHEDLQGAEELLEVITGLNCESEGWERFVDSNSGGVKEEVSFVELGKVWQAPFYEIALDFAQANKLGLEDGDSSIFRHDDQRLLPIFNNLVLNETNDDMVAEFLTSQYILPKESCFYMSDLGQMHSFLPARCDSFLSMSISDLGQMHSFLPDNSDYGFNLILVDPPWENRSAYQKSMYPTLPNRYFLSIPIGRLTHTRGALVALWVTNREKLRNFVENELFPAWGVRYVATMYWLKVKHDGSLICDLDLFHHRPYECLLLGYSGGEVIDSELLSMAKSSKDKKVIISIPGDYSRKPPVGELLLDMIPGPRPAQCTELFAREMMAGWTSWGNEPLRFQDLTYFSTMMVGKCSN